jgi:hypothetical protein
MLSSIGQSIVLCTHANAFLAGHDASITLDNPWFESFKSVRFRIGDDDSAPRGRTPNEWLQGLKADEFKGARLFTEPAGAGQDVDFLAFAGVQKWAPTTLLRSTEIIWHSRVTQDASDKVTPWSVVMGGYAVNSSDRRIVGSAEQARSALETILPQMSEFESTHSSGSSFRKLFDGGLRALGLERGFDERVTNLFPPGLYPPSSYQLVGAVNACWALGGMGRWNDQWFRDPDVQHTFTELTTRYFDAMGLALHAACNVPL